jgi:hypothetical protein
VAALIPPVKNPVTDTVNYISIIYSQANKNEEKRKKRKNNNNILICSSGGSDTSDKHPSLEVK